MTDTTTQDQALVSNYGDNQSALNRTTQTTVDPVTGASTRQSTTRGWSGRAPGAEFVWLIAGVVLTMLGLDFVLRATGANNVGFAAFVFSVGKFLAAPFAGIFKTSAAGQGSVLVWADVLAMVVYALIAFVIVKLVSMASARSASATG
jgi:hypothetical protein